KERPPLDLVPKFYEQFRDVLSVRQREQVMVAEFLNEDSSVRPRINVRLAFLEKAHRLLAPLMDSPENKKKLQERCGLSDQRMRTLEEKFDGLKDAIIAFKVEIAIRKSNKALQSGGLKEMNAAYEEVDLAWLAVSGSKEGLSANEKRYLEGCLQSVHSQLRVKMAKGEAQEALQSNDLEKMKAAYSEMNSLFVEDSYFSDIQMESLWIYSVALGRKIDNLKSKGIE
ncbi:hypothetical protein JYU14_05285, partial [Simkania negevensis]|nr:hypothetical protein [Simkania negevensis]